MIALTAEMDYLAFLKNGSLRRKKALINPLSSIAEHS